MLSAFDAQIVKKNAWENYTSNESIWPDLAQVTDYVAQGTDPRVDHARRDI